MISAEDEIFLEAVLTLAARSLRTGRTVAMLADDFASIPHAELRFCASQALCLVNASFPPAEFDEFAGMCRVLAQVGASEGETVTQRTFRLMTTADRVQRHMSREFVPARLG